MAHVVTFTLEIDGAFDVRSTDAIDVLREYTKAKEDCSIVFIYRIQAATIQLANDAAELLESGKWSDCVEKISLATLQDEADKASK